MNDELVRREPSRTSGQPARHFKRRTIELADGGALVLGNDGAIAHVDDHGVMVRSWSPDDPDWPGQAIRFGLHHQAPTVTPQGRRVQGTKPPR